MCSFVCFRLLFFPFLCFPKHNSSLPFVQGLVHNCVSMWRIGLVVQSRNVWEIKETSFNEQLVKQSVKWSLFSAELLREQKDITSVFVMVIKSIYLQFNLIIQNNKTYYIVCLSSIGFDLHMQHWERWPALSLNGIISMAVLSDNNHVDLKNSMTVALDFYTLFQTVYILYALV